MTKSTKKTPAVKAGVKKKREKDWTDEHDVKGVPIHYLEDMAKTYSLVRIGSDFAFAEDIPGKAITLLTEKTFKTLQLNKPYGDDRVRAFLSWKDRPQYDGVIFAPPPCIVPPGMLNKWRGFPVAPVKGDWSLLRAHIFTNVCLGDQLWFDWVMSWLADIIQNPGRKPGTALVLRGPMGVGKSTLVDFLRALLGRYSRSFADGQEVFGQFTGALEDILFMVFEEATFAGNPAYYSKQKDMITNHTMNIRHMHQVSYEGPNHIRAVIIGNPDWVVPAGENERRYMVLDVSDAKLQDDAYFGAINEQMTERGGLAAFMYDLQNWKQPATVNLRQAPKTPGLLKQQKHSFAGVTAWLYDCAKEGVVAEMEWDAVPVEVEVAKARETYRKTLGSHERHENDTKIGMAFGKWGIVSERVSFGGRTTRVYVFPSVHEMRKKFNTLYPGLFAADELGAPVELHDVKAAAEVRVLN